ncbi:MAG: hypothetical protein HRT66_07930 [Flavobacteriaceae bacterium]|nr:hypothetical protein [Flavobacteriaceae bacterium]
MKIKIFTCYIIIYLLVLNICSCNTKSVDHMELYFFKDDIHTPISVSCEGIYGYNGLRRLVLKNNTYVDSINYYLSDLKTIDIEYIDVRYKIITHKDTICMDEFGYITHKGVIKTDNKKMYKYVKSLIKKHIKESQIREEDILPEPIRHLQ